MPTNVKKTQSFEELMEEGYKKSAKENHKIALEMWPLEQEVMRKIIEEEEKDV